MVVNFRAHGISRGARKLAWTPTLIKKIQEEGNETYLVRSLWEMKTKFESNGGGWWLINFMNNSSLSFLSFFCVFFFSSVSVLVPLFFSVFFCYLVFSSFSVPLVFPLPFYIFFCFALGWINDLLWGKNWSSFAEGKPQVFLASLCFCFFIRPGLSLFLFALCVFLPPCKWSFSSFYRTGKCPGGSSYLS
jgi:hypothetical protein